MKYKILLIVFFASRLLLAQDVSLSYSTAIEEGMEQAILDAGVHMVNSAIEQDELRSAVILVAKNGKIVLHEALGWKDKGEAIPLKKDAMFRMASNTKPVIATGISILKDEKKLDYHDYVRKHLNSFDNYRSGSIKIHHLLTHTSGFRIKPIFYKPLIQKSKENPDAPNLRLEVDRFGETGAEVEVGTSYSYSNAGFNTLGALIETLSDKDLDVFLIEKVYQPLGMNDTYHHETKELLGKKLKRMSTVYYKENDEWTIGWKPGDEPQYPFVRASGGMISTAYDYAIFCQMFLNGGIYNGKRIISEESVAQMTFPQTKNIYTEEERENRDYYYGYGWRVMRNGSFGHGGSDGTVAMVDPDHKLIVLFFTQSPGESNAYANRFFQLVQASINK
ncbi:MAG: serine hydrolase domain-containing protein [Bacteroidota bacterium]|nr:serine hydrolase domain-containing protein [Bacteroidota bacterium]